MWKANLAVWIASTFFKTCRTILKPISRREGEKGEIAGNNMTFKIPLHIMKKHQRQIVCKLPLVLTLLNWNHSHILVMSAAVSLLHKSVDECCSGKESMSMCPREQWQWKKLWNSADISSRILWSHKHGNSVREMLTHFISLKHVILAFYWLTYAV